MDTVYPPDNPDIKSLVSPFLQLTAMPFDTSGEIVDFLQQVFTVSVSLPFRRAADRKKLNNP